MLIERMRRRLAADTKFIEPCLPSPADKPPSGSKWIHEIKHDGYRLMARRDHVSDMTIAGQGHGYQRRVVLGESRGVPSSRGAGPKRPFGNEPMA
jgi:hypothetical protein